MEGSIIFLTIKNLNLMKLNMHHMEVDMHHMLKVADVLGLNTEKIETMKKINTMSQSTLL